jgi:hypothetical protein
MREAESSLSLKEMRQKLAEFEQLWHRFLQLRGVTAAQLSLSASSPNANHPNSSSPDTQSAMSPASVDEEPPPQEPCQSPSTAAPQQQQHQSARARIAKLTATLIGAVGNSTAAANSTEGPETLESWTQRELEDNFIGLKIREADTIAELKEMRQKVGNRKILYK